MPPLLSAEELMSALEDGRGDVDTAARALGLSPSAFANRLVRAGIRKRWVLPDGTGTQPGQASPEGFTDLGFVKLPIADYATMTHEVEMLREQLRTADRIIETLTRQVESFSGQPQRMRSLGPRSHGTMATKERNTA